MSQLTDDDRSLGQKLMGLWYLWLILLGVGIAIGIGRSPGPSPDAPTPAPTSSDEQEALREEFEISLAKQEETPRSETKTTDGIIAEHQARLDELDENPVPDESAAILSALGNLHKQKKRDYRTAAGYYEILIEKYPEWPGINAVYHQLISCYTQLDDQQSLRLLYRKMVDVFPAESNEYEYANAGLEGTL